MLSLRRLKWALRKVRLPVSADGLVLDVGSGGKPYPRSDILLDRLTGAAHRCGSSMMTDRPVVLADASRMPFREKAFDFVVASHVLEHMSQPAAFLEELSRVGRAGYIETPNFVFERLIPYEIHCLEVGSISGCLHIHKKKGSIEDAFIASLHLTANDPGWRKLFYQAPDLFHARHFWTERIDYRIDNPETCSDWIEKINADGDVGGTQGSYLDERRGWRELGLAAINRFCAISRRRRLARFDLLSILVCPECKGELARHSDVLTCLACETAYGCVPYPDFTRTV